MIYLCLTILLLAPPVLANEHCDGTRTLKPGQTIQVKSPNYPRKYPAGSSCQYKFRAPLDHHIEARCGISLPSKKGACTTDKFWVGSDGEPLMRSGNSICGSRTVLRDSHSQDLALAYRSNGTDGGNFKCSLTPVARTCTCGWTGHIDRRIVNGNNVEDGKYPSMVALKDMTNYVQKTFCGGTIVAHKFILTAAHCLGHVGKASDISAIAGTTNLRNPRASRYLKIYRIRRSIPHRLYDIAILETVEYMMWTRGVGPACLMPLGTKQTFANEFVDVAGFGTTSFGGPLSDVLRKITLVVTTNEVCQDEYLGYDTIMDHHLCAYDYLGRHRDSCQFDSGGPVYLNKARQHLIGVITMGRSCAESAYAMGINMRITSFLGWIRTQIGNTHCPVEIQRN